MFNSDGFTLPNVLIMIADFLLWPHDWTAGSDDAGYLRENLRTWGGKRILCFDDVPDAEIHMAKISLIIFEQVTLRACLFMSRESHKLKMITRLPHSLIK